MRKISSKPLVSTKKLAGGTLHPPNPYLMALLTASLAGLFSVVGGYFAAGFQARHAIAQKQLDYRVGAYEAFLNEINQEKEPSISQLLSIGAMAAHLATDGEIQAFEDQIADLLKKHDAQDLYWQLNADFNILRLHGSTRVGKISDDILKTLLLHDEEIDWTNYSPEVAAFHSNWKASQENGFAYGWEEKISGDERLMIVSIAKLTRILVEQLRWEIQETSI